MWNIIGQKKSVSLLQRSLETGYVSHAYMFIGPAHAGKMTLAMELAKALNCNEDDAPCGHCDSCRKVVEHKHADVQVIGIGQDDSSGDNSTG